MEKKEKCQLEIKCLSLIATNANVSFSDRSESTGVKTRAREIKELMQMSCTDPSEPNWLDQLHGYKWNL